MSTVPKYTPHYTLADYAQWSGDWELWQGTAVAMTPSPFGKHQFVGANLVGLLRNALRGTECRVLYEIDWIISEDTVVRPDVVVHRGTVPDRHLETPPVLIAEILSPSTELKDRTSKRELYQQEGVQHYLMADPTAESLVALELLDGCYRERNFDSDLVLDLTSCQVNLAVKELWD